MDRIQKVIDKNNQTEIGGAQSFIAFFTHSMWKTRLPICVTPERTFYMQREEEKLAS